MKVLALVAALAAASCTPRTSHTKNAPASVDQRIGFYQERVTKNPRLYPVWVQLGDAYLDKAKATSDPAYIAKAHEAADRSLAIQDSYEAFHLKAKLFGHTHHFEEALGWARKAEAAAIEGPDWMIIALEVEMLVGAGRIDEAKAKLPAEGAPITDFYAAAALARVANVERRFPDAAKYYSRAAELARDYKVTKLVAWAEAMTGGMLLDGGNLAEALPHLDAAKASGGCAEERIHRAELLAHTGKQPEALAMYDAYLKKTPDPAVYHAAWKLAHEMGDKAAERTYYDAAIKGYRAVIDAGEVYTLGGLAKLELEANGDPREALALAEQNFKYKRDPEAQQTLAEAKRRVEALPR